MVILESWVFLMSELPLYLRRRKSPISWILSSILPPVINVGPIRLFQILDLYWNSPESGNSYNTSRQMSGTICSRSKRPETAKVADFLDPLVNLGLDLVALVEVEG